jgi:prepilin-type N-terminal cleavage/methylation domain-containing protein
MEIVRTGKLKDDKGFSLNELIITMSLFGILVGMGLYSYQSINDRLNVEKDLKEMYVDLMNARIKAIQRNRLHFVLFTASPAQYAIYEDTDPAPDGDTQLDIAKDTRIMQKYLVSKFTVSYPDTWNYAYTALRFTSRGLLDTSVTSAGTFRVTRELNGEYDCIIISDLKNNVGKWDVTTSSCKAK